MSGGLSRRLGNLKQYQQYDAETLAALAHRVESMQRVSLDGRRVRASVIRLHTVNGGTLEVQDIRSTSNGYWCRSGRDVYFVPNASAGYFEFVGGEIK